MNRSLSALLVLALAALMIVFFIQVSWPTANPDQNSNSELGQQLFGTTSDPGFSPVILMIAILLLVALLGAVFLAKEEEEKR